MDHLANLDVRNSAIARRSAAPRPWAITAVRELTKDDLVLLLAGAGPNDPKAPLARISAAHHMLAEMVAKGKADVEISAVTGYAVSRVKTLRADPAFAELVSHYEAEVVRAHADVQAQISHIALAAGQLIQEKLDDPDEQFSLKELQSLWSQGLDRIGHGPSSKVTHDINDPSGVIQGLQKMLTAEDRGRIISRAAIEAEFTEIANEPAEARPGAEESNTGTDGAVLGGAEIEGPQGSGDSVPEPSPPTA